MNYAQSAGSIASGQRLNDASPETMSMTITRQMNDMADILNRIEASAAMICGGYGDSAKQAGPAAVPNGLHAQWADQMATLLGRAERVANTLSSI